MKLIKNVVFTLLLVLAFSSNAFSNDKININSATESELQSLTGVGQVTAQAIIEYRELNGPFKQLSQLANVKGIGQKKVATLSDAIKLGDE